MKAFTFKELKKLTGLDYELISSKEALPLDEISVEGPSNIECPLRKTLCFVHEKKVFERWGRMVDFMEDISHEVGLLWTRSAWEKLSDDEKVSFQERFLFVLTVQDVYMAMVRLSKIFHQEIYKDVNTEVDGRQLGTVDIHPTARIAQNVFIGQEVTIGENVVIHPGVTIMGPCEIEDHCEIFPQVTIYPFVKIGRHSRIHSQVSIGSDGFGYHMKDGVHHKIWQMGGVLIGEDVEIGSNTSVDCGTFSPTIIGDGCKIDNLVQVAHNCVLGSGVVLCGNVGLSGSVVIGDYCVFGGKSGIAPGMTLGAKCQVAGGALINCDWKEGSVLGGHPARPLKEWMRGLAFVRKAVTK